MDRIIAKTEKGTAMPEKRFAPQRRRRSSCTEDSGYAFSDFSFCDESTIATDAASASSTAGFCIPPLAHPDEATFYLRDRIWTSRPESNYKIRQTETTNCFFPCGLNARVKASGKSKGRIMKVVFRDDDKRVFAVCSKEKEEQSSSSSSTNDAVADENSSSLVYKIFSAAPTISGKQRPAKKTSSSRMRLYHWAQVTVDAESASPCSPIFKMNVWDGKAFVEGYTCTRRRRKSNEAATMLPSFGKSFSFAKGEVPCGFMEKDSKCIASHWQVSILPCFDPCLLLCFASIVDDLLCLSAMQEALSLRELALSLSGMMVSKQSARSLGEKSLGDAASNSENAAAALNESATSLGFTETAKRRSGSNRAA